MTLTRKLLLLVILFLGLTLHAQQRFTEKQKAGECLKIREACRHAWKGYKKYARGCDALNPISKTGRNWYGVSFLMTPLDGFDTFYILGMKKEADEAREMVVAGMNFNVDREVQLFRDQHPADGRTDLRL